MENTIFDVYVPMESQEQCDRMKQLCIDNDLDIWKDEESPDYPFCYDEHSNSHFAFNFCEFAIWNGEDKTLNQVTESEFIDLLKKHKL